MHIMDMTKFDLNLNVVESRIPWMLSLIFIEFKYVVLHRS